MTILFNCYCYYHKYYYSNLSSLVIHVFSYSYDLTHSLQYNMAPVRHIDDMVDVTSAAPWPPGEAGENVEDEGSHVEEACTFTLGGEEGEGSVGGSQQLPDLGAGTEGNWYIQHSNEFTA